MVVCLESQIDTGHKAPRNPVDPYWIYPATLIPKNCDAGLTFVARILVS
jgi:hypothetical protein